MRRPPAPVAMKEGPDHGGRLNAAVRRWGTPRDQWLDLSTGINPTSWPLPEIPAEIWQRLPEADDGLHRVIRDWAGITDAAACLAVAGSQAAIQALPRLRHPCRVAVPAPGYREHGHCWASAGHEVVPLAPDAFEDQLDRFDVVIWIQPNNPTGQTVSAARLRQWHRRLARRNGWLLVDEAFIGEPGVDSIASDVGPEGLIVLRSLGKFFGLAGLRAGAVLAWPELCACLDKALGPWAVTGPSRYLMAAALTDQPWQAQMVEQLQHHRNRLRRLLAGHDLAPSGGSLLFQYLAHPRAAAIADALAGQAVLVRQFADPPALRFGLPGPEAQWRHLDRALSGCLRPRPQRESCDMN